MAEKKRNGTDAEAAVVGEQSDAGETPVEETEMAEAVVADDVPAADEAMVAVPEQEAPAAGAQPETEAAKAADVEPETSAEPVEPDAAEPGPVEAPAIVGETEPAVEPDATPEPEAPVEPEATVEEPVVEPEAAAAAPTDEDPPAAAAPAPETPAAKTRADETPAAPVQQSGPKPKRKRLPRSLRPQRTRPKREKATERKPIVRLSKPEQELGRRQERQGTVVSDAMNKTIVVKVDTIGMHRRYKKVIRQSKKFHAHDETNQAKLGDVVRIVETRPLSKSKNWRLAEIVEVAK